MNNERLARIMAILGSCYGRKIDAATVAAYAMVLDDLPIDCIEKATLCAMKTEEYFPTPATIRKYADDGGDKAWERVLEGIRRDGRHRSITFGTRINACIRQLGGWVRLCDLGGDQLHVWMRKEFLRLYSQNTDEEYDHALDCIDPDPKFEARYAQSIGALLSHNAPISHED